MIYDTLFLDRDGVINKKIENGYVLSFKDIEILPGITEFLHWAHQSFRQIIVVTNQRCVGRKMIKLDDIAIINQEINKRTGNLINRFFVCPHLVEDNCSCRKPKDGLFLAAVEHYSVDFENSWMIGDSESDLIPAKRLLVNTIFVSDTESTFADVRVNSTAELIEVFTSQH